MRAFHKERQPHQNINLSTSNAGAQKLFTTFSLFHPFAQLFDAFIHAWFLFLLFSIVWWLKFFHFSCNTLRRACVVHNNHASFNWKLMIANEETMRTKRWRQWLRRRRRRWWLVCIRSTNYSVQEFKLRKCTSKLCRCVCTRAQENPRCVVMNKPAA